MEKIEWSEVTYVKWSAAKKGDTIEGTYIQLVPSNNEMYPNPSHHIRSEEHGDLIVSSSGQLDYHLKGVEGKTVKITYDGKIKLKDFRFPANQFIIFVDGMQACPFPKKTEVEKVKDEGVPKKKTFLTKATPRAAITNEEEVPF